jgi:hypothetical protein
VISSYSGRFREFGWQAFCNTIRRQENSSSDYRHLMPSSSTPGYKLRSHRGTCAQRAATTKWMFSVFPLLPTCHVYTEEIQFCTWHSLTPYIFILFVYWLNQYLENVIQNFTTNSIIDCLFEEIIVSQIVKKFPTFTETEDFFLCTKVNIPR